MTEAAAFQALFRYGRCVTGQRLDLRYRANGRETSRGGVTVRRLPGLTSVGRHRLIRLGREAFRRQRAALRPGWDLLLVMKSAASVAYRDVAAELRGLTVKAGLTRDTTPGLVDNNLS
ncbi:MAG: ribonuclease P protein component [Candidatus Omnitrophica bacterium]|nr:ribonuclease P protein component [Candidatus Omnitrophota bacterium]